MTYTFNPDDPYPHEFQVETLDEGAEIAAWLKETEIKHRRGPFFGYGNMPYTIKFFHLAELEDATLFKLRWS